MPTNPSPCPGCTNRRAPGKYLCATCWSALTAAARRQLNRRGDGAITRYRSLHDQLQAGVPLADIRID
ncbi:hypothetical protein [Streptomyces sp. NRRL F-5123]|uniref:hypothetical protein n=1 Tax=Streptomyces sp. NRRL F-5123 TaxID=1463856 RepID=UPI0004E225BD|nr:hypothetical protein [Streptomyces sp. NRRL F-5123]